MNDGEQAPNVAFLFPDGRTGRLADFAGKNLLLIFIRHIG
jgi:peroxiredoxin